MPYFIAECAINSNLMTWNAFPWHFEFLNAAGRCFDLRSWNRSTQEKTSGESSCTCRGCCLTTMCRVVHSVLQQMLGDAVVWTGISLMVDTKEQQVHQDTIKIMYVWRWVYQNSVSKLCLMDHWMTLVRYQNCLESPHMVLAWIGVECFICLFILLRFEYE